MHIPNLDPRTKVLAFVATILVVFLCRDIYILAAIFALTITAIPFISRRSDIFMRLKTLLPALVVALVLWSTLYGWSIFYRYGGEGIKISIGLFMSLRLLVIMTTSLIFVYSITPGELVAALNLLGLPYKPSFIFGLSLRYVFYLSDEYKAIREAQVSRGLEVDKGFLLTRIRNHIPIVMPLLIRSIEEAERSALAMKLRLFSFRRRSRYVRYRMGCLDYLLVTLFIISVALVILHYPLGVI